MSGFASGLGFLILTVVLLFAWLAIAAYATAELAFIVGLAVIFIWVMFFLPAGFIKELIWQGRQKRIMQSAMEMAPSYQPGSALPPPMSGNSLSVIEQPAGGGAIDIYRDDLPQLLPQLEPRPHGLMFMRSLVLPVVGVLMMVGASNETFMQTLLEARGMMQKLPIAWEQLTLTPEFSAKQGEMVRAARMALRREGNCSKILRGNIAAVAQFATPMQLQSELDRGDYVYEFYCQAGADEDNPYLIWITPDQISRGSFASLRANFSSRLTVSDAELLCHTAANKALEPLHAIIGATSLPEPKPLTIPARMPYGDYMRRVSAESLIRDGIVTGQVHMSCWVNNEGEANVRFYK